MIHKFFFKKKNCNCNTPRFGVMQVLNFLWSWIFEQHFRIIFKHIWMLLKIKLCLEIASWILEDQMGSVKKRGGLAPKGASWAKIREGSQPPLLHSPPNLSLSSFSLILFPDINPINPSSIFTQIHHQIHLFHIIITLAWVFFPWSSLSLSLSPLFSERKWRWEETHCSRYAPLPSSIL